MYDLEHMENMYSAMSSTELAEEYTALRRSLHPFLSGSESLVDSPVRECLDATLDIMLLVIADRFVLHTILS